MLLLLLAAMSVDSKVDSVVLYTTHALVTRIAHVEVSASGKLVFDGLTGDLDDNTIRVSSPGMKIGEVQIIKGELPEPTPMVQRLADKVMILEDSMRMLDDEAAVLRAQSEFVTSVKLGSPEIIAKELQQGRVAVESWRGALGFVAGELTRVKTRDMRLGREKTALQRRLEAAKSEHQAARSEIETRKTLSVEYAAEPGSYTVRFSYLVGRDAGWMPYYELRARPGEKKIDVVYFAKIAQSTGEDWSGVHVVLSTVRPLTSAQLPAVNPWELTLVPLPEPGKPPLVRSASVAMERIIGEQAVPRTMPKDMAELMVDVSETGISLQYAIPGRISLKSGEPAKKYALSEVTVPAEFNYYTFPRVDSKVFLQGRAVNTTGLIMLPGFASTYVADEFTGTYKVPPVAPGESTSTSYGVDDRVKVKRELVKSLKSRVGAGKRTERISYSYKITVENFYQRAIEVALQDLVPVSRESGINVKVTRIEPKPDEGDDASGSRLWKLQVPAGEKQQVFIEFEIDYPAERQVKGL